MLESIVLSIALLIILHHWWSHRHHNGYPYVYSSIPFFGGSFHFRLGAVKCVQQWVKDYGTIFNVTVLGQPMTLIADSSLFPTISRNPKLSLLPLKLYMMRVGFGAVSYDQLTSDVQIKISASTRKSINEQLGRNKPSLEAINHASVVKLLEKLNLPTEPTKVCVYPWLNRILFSTLMELFYGPDLATVDFQADFDAWDAKFTALYAGFPARWLKVDGPRDRVKNHLREYAAKHLQDVSTVVQERLSICDTNGVQQIDKDGHQLSFVWAMTTNTIRTCFWTLVHLQNNPQAWKCIMNEISSNITDSTKWNREEMDKCVYLDSAIKETLRVALNSSAVRYATEDLTLDFPDGRQLVMKEGDGLVMQSNIGYFDPERYTNPFCYKFDRFVEKPELAKEFTPFGFGKYLCPGQYYAVDFVKIVVSTLMLNAHITDFGGSSEYKYNTVGVYVPINPQAITMSIKKRQAASA
ncbi:25-hydroxycholesterol 7-alpha-hydroxylase-like [Thraustotheca clavata]|uniref:25-hydroxycholesterol 7-alpha-hydroxylase-like n=1 Tax=Thraustotheca clavata TaxID=74557 RepID=A0A0A7CM04_9STRA|nr:secreted protein [Thraustotheca clavata]OQS06439.1 25-hydroxycholesterol 7-alpha-hydroxylase-like [Thraustotheca clavata]